MMDRLPKKFAQPIQSTHLPLRRYPPPICSERKYVTSKPEPETRVWPFPNPKTRIYRRNPGLETLLPYRYRIVSAFLISFFRYIVIVSVMNEISVIFNRPIFCIFLLSAVLNFTSSNIHINRRTKRSNASSTAAYNSCNGESTNGGPVACKGLHAMKVVTCCYSIHNCPMCVNISNLHRDSWVKECFQKRDW